MGERTVRILLECFLVTTRKRSLGQGNMFTGVCLSTEGVPAPGGLPALGGVFASGGVPGGDLPPRRLLLRAVCIPLECILVYDLI